MRGDPEGDPCSGARREEGALFPLPAPLALEAWGVDSYVLAPATCGVDGGGRHGGPAVEEARRWTSDRTPPSPPGPSSRGCPQSSFAGPVCGAQSGVARRWASPCEDVRMRVGGLGTPGTKPPVEDQRCQPAEGRGRARACDPPAQHCWGQRSLRCASERAAPASPRAPGTEPRYSLAHSLTCSFTHSFVHSFVSPPAVAPARTFLRPRGPHRPRHTLRRHWPLRLSEPVVAAAVVITTPACDRMPAGKTSVAGRPALGDAR